MTCNPLEPTGLNDEKSTEDAPAELIPHTSPFERQEHEAPLRVGQFVIVSVEKSDGTKWDWFGCIMKMGSNYVRVESPRRRGSYEFKRIHFNDVWEQLTVLTDREAQDHIQKNIEIANSNTHALISEVNEITHRLGLGSHFDVIKTADQVKQEQFEWSRGERVPGRAPETREDFRYRLEVLARAYHNEAGSWRKHQLLRQFNDCADTIELAKAKREWLLREVDWYQSHNIPPEMSDLWFESMASPSLLKKPREQDFDPDPLERRKRTPFPAEIVAERLSIPNVLSFLKRMGCRAYIALAAENVYDKAVICINFNEVPGRSKVRLYGERSDSQTSWQIKFDCGNSKQADRRKVRIMLLPSYNNIEHMLADALARQQQPINRQDTQTSQ